MSTMVNLIGLDSLRLDWILFDSAGSLQRAEGAAFESCSSPFFLSFFFPVFVCLVFFCLFVLLFFFINI